MEQNFDHLPYRQGVGAMILNAQGHVFVGQRSDGNPGWQMPQGGIDSGENPETSLKREIYEETGIKTFEILKRSQELAYDFPPIFQREIYNGQYRGQRQTWFLCQFHGNDSEINLNCHLPPEFKAWKWVERPLLPELVIPFKRKFYEEILSAFDLNLGPSLN